MAQAEISVLAVADPTGIGFNTDTDPFLDSNGNIYGIMNSFGPSGAGSIYEYNVTTQQINLVYAIPATATFPFGRPYINQEGDVFGAKGDSVFEYNVSSESLTSLPVDPSLGSPSDGVYGDTAGDAFFTTTLGGGPGNGALVEWAAGTQSLTTVATFNGTDGSNPEGMLSVDSAGDVFGATFGGGEYGDGVIYEVAAHTNAVQVLYDFSGGMGGLAPQGGLVADAQGNLYGAASDGVEQGGIIYELTAGSHQFEVLAALTGTQPISAPIVDAAGNVFGEGVGGGANGDGTVYEIAAGSGTATIIASFDTFHSGFGSLVADSAGTLYGLSGNIDGQGNSGVFEITDSGFQTAAQCYCPGTLIATRHGERPVESLQIGDDVTALDGTDRPIRWIGRRSYDGRFIAGQHLMLPVCIKADAIAPGQPSRDLWVSPGHAVFIDGRLVPAWRLINDVSIVQAEAVDRVDYLHIELDRHDVLFANGLPAESYLDEGSRGQFENAAAFFALRPGAEPGAPYAPRLEDGFALDRIQRRVARRAGIRAARRKPGVLRGYIELFDGAFVQGWAQDAAHPEAPVTLALPDGSTVLANAYRADLRAASIGSGCHGFRVRLAALPTMPIEVYRVCDRQPLRMTDDMMQRSGVLSAA